ncbi:LuxR C-terminal-related transcriptional regulator [Azospirillum picis]|uniref:DNA-binding NarL/FixJ family response regulator n=1 Tax=Azospirillum picis TaxID=488438 RepID=A0ABU0MJ63_9PROT|nr:response regulator transcription factor [Azospirillum picis]MBP2299426.1 DNA-binding NarL/FixJ family response regulator [Azospirillum picis]MDQ0533447.1 DNA-binding NarL/FixJ family response regulator [Azospirillum picis]
MNVLIADDHLLFRDGLRRLLAQFDAEMTFFEASSYDEVLALCDGSRHFDLILLDLGMPGWTGFSALGEIHANLPKALLVVVSGSEKRSDLLAALENGAAGYIPKSSSAKVLLGALQLVLAGGIYLPEQAIRGGERLDHGHAPYGGNGSTDAADDQSPFANANGDQLTPRQRDVLARLRDGKSNKQIAHELGLTEGTVKVHVTAILRHLGVRNRTQAALTAQSL